jgi:hypothetical protein
MKNKTECIYCGSTSYGKTCYLSPNKVHVHTGDPTVCIYCGSKAIGSGCYNNPYGKIHVRGPEFLNRFTEQAEKSILLKYFLEKINKDEEKQSNSFLDNFYSKVRSMITNLSVPLLESFFLMEKPTYKNLDKEQMVIAIESKKLVSSKLSEMKDILSEINLVLPTEIVEEIIVDAIISSK